MTTFILPVFIMNNKMFMLRVFWPWGDFITSHNTNFFLTPWKSVLVLQLQLMSSKRPNWTMKILNTFCNYKYITNLLSIKLPKNYITEFHHDGNLVFLFFFNWKKKPLRYLKGTTDHNTHFFNTNRILQHTMVPVYKTKKQENWTKHFTHSLHKKVRQNNSGTVIKVEDENYWKSG